MDPISSDEARIVHELIRAGGDDGIRKWCWMPNHALNSQLDPPSGLAVEMTGRCNVLRNLFHPLKMFYGSLAVPLTPKAYERVSQNMRSKDYVRRLAASLVTNLDEKHFPKGKGNFAGLYSRLVKGRRGRRQELWMVVQCGDEKASMHLHNTIENKLSTSKVGSIIRKVDLASALAKATDSRIDCITALARCCINPDDPDSVDLAVFGMTPEKIRVAIDSSPVVPNNGADDENEFENEDEDDHQEDGEEPLNHEAILARKAERARHVCERRIKRERNKAMCLVECFNDLKNVVATETISYMFELAQPTKKYVPGRSTTDGANDDEYEEDKNAVEIEGIMDIALVGEVDSNEYRKRAMGGGNKEQQQHQQNATRGKERQARPHKASHTSASTTPKSCLVYYAGCTPTGKRNHGGVIVCEKPYKGVTVLLGEPDMCSVFGKKWDAPAKYLGAFPTGMGRQLGQRAEVTKMVLDKRAHRRQKKKNDGKTAKRGKENVPDDRDREEASDISTALSENNKSNVCVVWNRGGGGHHEEETTAASHPHIIGNDTTPEFHPLLADGAYRNRNYTSKQREKTLGHEGNWGEVDLSPVCLMISSPADASYINLFANPF